MFGTLMWSIVIILFIALPISIILLIIRAIRRKPIKKIFQSIMALIVIALSCFVGALFTVPEDAQTEQPSTTEEEIITPTTSEVVSETTTVATIVKPTNQEIMIKQFIELGFTEDEAKEAQEIFANVGITKISDLTVRSRTVDGLDGEIQYTCNFNHFDRKTQEIGLGFIIMRRKIQRVDICNFPHGNTFEFYKSLTMLDGIEKGDSVVLYYKKLKGYLQVDENSVGYRAVYDSATHSVSKY